MRDSTKRGEQNKNVSFFEADLHGASHSNIVEFDEEENKDSHFYSTISDIASEINQTAEVLKLESESPPFKRYLTEHDLSDISVEEEVVYDKPEGVITTQVRSRSLPNLSEIKREISNTNLVEIDF